MQVVVFKVNEEQFAVEASKVQSINDMMEITKVPKSEGYIKGLINLKREYNFSLRYKSPFKYRQGHGLPRKYNYIKPTRRVCWSNCRPS